MSTDPQSSNLERFNLTALALFSRLYDAFPNPIEVKAQNLGLSASPDEAELAEHLRFMVYAEHAVTWLAEEGFIRYESHGLNGGFAGVRLTLRGLTVLGYVPTAVKGKKEPETLIVRIKRALGSGADKAAADGVKALITEVFKLAASPATWQAVTTAPRP
jgi:hypothetical protein